MDPTLFLIVFGVASAVVIPLIWRFARGRGHHYLRPRLGEVVLISIIAFAFAGGAAAGISSLLGTDKRSIENFRSARPGKSHKKKESNRQKAKVLDTLLSPEGS